MGILSVDLNNFNLGDVNFNEDDPETLIHVRLMAWRNRFKQRKACKKDIYKGLLSVVSHPTRWWDWCMPQNKKQEIEPILIDET